LHRRDKISTLFSGSHIARDRHCLCNINEAKACGTDCGKPDRIAR
jgi:hypothetical protein